MQLGRLHIGDRASRNLSITHCTHVTSSSTPAREHYVVMRYVLRCKPSGLIHFGLPCDSFIWISKSGHKRSGQNPYGNTTRQGVRRGNILLCRSMLLAILATVRRCFWFLENPGSSFVPQMPEVIHVMSWAEAVFNHYHIYWWPS